MGGVALKNVASMFKTKKTSVYDHSQPYSCLDIKCAGFDKFNIEYATTTGYVRETDLEEHVLSQIVGSPFESVSKNYLEKSEIILGGAEFINTSFVFDSPTGSIGALHVIL